VYQTIQQKLADTREERTRFIQSFTKPIRRELQKENLDFNMHSRTKSISSIWGKMKKKEVPFEEVYDIFAVRIVLSTRDEREKADCWRAYSIVTDIYQPNPDRLRDWISTPKANGYESLHTTVMSRQGRWVEVQIRSERMDEIAEKGYAAHWKYKETKSGESGIDKWLRRIREILKSAESDALDFIDDFKLNLFSDEIIVFTPKGELRTLPKGSTALDFAYSIHTQVGDKCLGAKVNHKLVALSYELKSGDQVEIITSRKQAPKTDWLNYVTTARAKGKIKSALKEKRKKQAEEGKEILERKLKQFKIDHSQETVNKLLDYFKLSSPLDLYYEIAIENIGQKEIKAFATEQDGGGLLSYIRKPFSRARDQQADKEPPKDPIRQQLKDKPDTLLIGDSIDNLSYKLSPCCNPIPGDDVFGFVTIQDGIKIHRNNCPNAMQLMSKYAYRVVKAKWMTNKSIAFLSGLRLKGIDQAGLLQTITNTISSENNVNIRNIHLDTHDGTFEGELMVYINDTQHLNSLIRKLKKVNGIQKVSRIGKMEASS